MSNSHDSDLLTQRRVWAGECFVAAFSEVLHADGQLSDVGCSHGAENAAGTLQEALGLWEEGVSALVASFRDEAGMTPVRLREYSDALGVESLIRDAISLLCDGDGPADLSVLLFEMSGAVEMVK